MSVMSVMSANVLDRETSPYLLQHADNPVHWQPWGAAALERAARENKPILLSVGYAACHWCHVMAHESFEDPETAALMNAHFVSVKVDREERPDIDAIYQTALALLGQHGGWPLTMFLSPDGEPFWGGTYFPPDSRYGRPGFRDVLRRLHQIYSSDQDAVIKNRGALREALEKLSEPTPGTPAVTPTLGLLDKVAEQLVGQVDFQHGGLGGAPKFPHVPVFELLWRAYLRSGSAPCRDAVLVTLERMCQGGIYDHLSGGFARYATDGQWLVPHFEKMLYDNAQLLDLLTLVWQHGRQPLHAQRARETAEWVIREMRAAGGGFAATQDADAEGVEGKFHVWDEAEIDALLGPGAESFKTAYGVTPGGNWEGH
ncbi:MAG: thioredoxin domain-containing protein, partial [Alphaproteobacteria bacterium]